MERKHILRKKLLAILRAAAYGAIFFGLMLVADDLAYRGFGKGEGWIPALITALALLQAIPSMATGINIYLVNGFIGASLFGLLAAFWQFVIKEYEE